MYKPVVLITGASGFIGRQLVKFLLKQDYHVIGLTRERGRLEEHPDFHWIHQFDEIKSHRIDYVINLAGENIGKGRWSTARKKRLLASRVETTRALYEYLQKYQIKPKRIISASAVGFYGIDHDEKWEQVCTEDSLPQYVFMSELCAQWEQVALSYPEQDTKIMRLGVVLGHGGALPQMLLPIQLNLFGRIGSGRQPFAWVHMHDVLAAIDFLLREPTYAQIFNVVAPEKINQIEFSRTAARLLKRKPFFPLPRTVMELMLGEQALLLLNGQYVQPKALLEAGFIFEFPTLKAALTDLIGH